MPRREDTSPRPVMAPWRSPYSPLPRVELAVLSMALVGLALAPGDVVGPKEMSTGSHESAPAPLRAFATTQWNLVLTAGQGDSAPAQIALETLCKVYWYPIYVYVRRKGYGPEDAQDLTQSFFARLIAQDHLRRADRSKGKFRTFLLATLNYFVAREWSREHRQKRGGQFQFISFDEPALEERYRLEPAGDGVPDIHFDRQWALIVLERAMNALRDECVAAGKEDLFHEVKHLVSGDGAGERSHVAPMADRLAMTEGAARVAIHRLRRRFGELLRGEIAQTVSDPNEIDAEVRHLLAALSP